MTNAQTKQTILYHLPTPHCWRADFYLKVITFAHSVCWTTLTWQCKICNMQQVNINPTKTTNQASKQASTVSPEVDSSWNRMAHGDTQEGKWRGNWQMEWVASTLHTTSEHGVSSITTTDAHTSAASSRLNWCPRWFKWTHPFCWKTKSGFCACAITFQLASSKLQPMQKALIYVWNAADQKLQTAAAISPFTFYTQNNTSQHIFCGVVSTQLLSDSFKMVPEASTTNTVLPLTFFFMTLFNKHFAHGNLFLSCQGVCKQTTSQQRHRWTLSQYGDIKGKKVR